MNLSVLDLTLGLGAAYLLVLALSMRKGSREIHGPWLFLLRAFFPNWKFYHAVALSPRLYVRAQTGDGAWTDWALVYPRMPRRLWHLWHNAAVNLALTHQNLVEHLALDARELPEGADARTLVTYRLVQRLACEAVRGGRWGPVPMLDRPDWPRAVTACQFEVRMEMPDHGHTRDHTHFHTRSPSRSECLLQSPVIRAWN